MSESANPLDHLKSCTVCINRSSSSRGTGFFVARGQILTCHHVIKDKTKIEIWWQSKPYPVEVIESSENVDLALLQLTGDVPEHSVVELGVTVAIADPLYSFGYTDQYVEGDPADFSYVDETGGDWPLMKFKEGQVRPGLSGSPLLNRRTGKVCGVVKKTRDRSTDLGGRGIPMTTVFQVFAQLQPQQAMAANPFTQLGMLDRLEDIYGRDRELRDIFSFLNSKASVALIGCSGMGTSSLLRAIELQSPAALSGRSPKLLNMREILGIEEYYATLADAIHSTETQPFQIQRELKKHRLLLLLDEVEQLRENWFNDGVRRQLRAWANMGDRSPIRLVVAAHRPLTELFEDSGMDSPFANICHEIELKPWDATTIQGFIETRLANTGVQFSPQEIEEIVTESNGIPGQVMQWCYHVYERYRD
ncbi:MAG: trypsin-like peptidase domain-containing protein [Spirulinaceae cyanobacterium]